MRNIEEMSDHELLMELIKDKRRNDRIRYVKYAVFGVIAVFVIGLLAVYVPKVVTFVNRYNTVIDELEKTTNSIKELKDSINLESFNTVQELIDKIQKVLAQFGIR